MTSTEIPSAAEAARVAAPEHGGGSGEAAGAPSSPSRRATARRSPDAARVETIALERAGVVAYARDYQAQVRKLVARGRLAEEDGELICRQVEIFAEGVAAGLHVHAIEGKAVRRAVRAALETSHG